MEGTPHNTEVDPHTGFEQALSHFEENIAALGAALGGRKLVPAEAEAFIKKLRSTTAHV